MTSPITPAEDRMSDWRTLSVTEAVEATGFSRDRLYDLVKARAIAVIRTPGPRRPGHIRIVAASLEAWMRKQTTPVVEAAPSPGYDADREIPIRGKRLFS